MLLTGLGIRNQKVRFHVVAFALFEDLVRAIFVFILHIKNGIDEVLALQHPKAILPPESREYGAVVEGGLPIQVKLRGPPGSCAVFKLAPEGVEVIPASLGPTCYEILDFPIPTPTQILT